MTGGMIVKTNLVTVGMVLANIILIIILMLTLSLFIALSAMIV